MIRVLVADDHAVVRRGVIQILAEAPGVVAVGEAGTGRQVLQMVREQGCDLLVLDIAMPDGGGLEVLQELETLAPDVPVLVLTTYPERQYAIRALKAGAAGYLTKESAPDELIEAIRVVSRGGKYITRSLAQTLAEELRRETPAEPHAALSNREYQVMTKLAAGTSLSDIAAEFSLSVKTVSTYRARILQKLQLSNTAEIVRYAFEHGLVD